MSDADLRHPGKEPPPARRDHRLSLAARLRHETATAHRAAERAPLVAEMLGGRLDRQRYVLLLRNLLPVYQLLEQPDDAGGSALSGFPLDSIARAGALAQDLNALHGGGWLDEVPHLAAGRAYRDRVAACRRSAPALLAAHAYVRYLGDLSGGRVLGRALRQTLGPGSAGLAFYDFPGLTSVEAARADFRRALDALPLREEEAQAVVDEARTAFRLNLRVLEAVERPPTHAGA